MIVVGVGGVPGAGKSQLLRAVLPALGPGRPFARRAARGTLSGSGVLVLGTRYGEPDPYPGTDRLSMAVQPDALALLDDPPPGVRALLFEGDRLFNLSFLRACLDRRPGSRFFLLEAPEAVLAARRAARADAKPPAFLKGRATKCARILAALPAVERLASGSVADLERNAATLLGALAGR